MKTRRQGDTDVLTAPTKFGIEEDWIYSCKGER
ncbi:hypothetical protein A5886_000243 [Enterococcus sp. 8G7_MSG3316]|uniref:Uncharacterized protein n=1 Tax=Candidatus Enterococcus testudinis TaxID=1834191 RepID=A0A242A3J1_9ENTE|nr:hypothetical protein A5886_000243 [Enterococcus sp. 8G7_MSG3316]